MKFAMTLLSGLFVGTGLSMSIAATERIEHPGWVLLILFGTFILAMVSINED